MLDGVLAAALICLWVVGIYLVIVTSSTPEYRPAASDLQTLAWLILLSATGATFWVLWDRLAPVLKSVMTTL